MSPADTLRLILLSSLWGMSFIFMRVAVPEFGPVPLILLRMGVGALLLIPLLLSLRYLKLVWENKGGLLLLGLVNHVLPFVLLALATMRLEAGFTSLINATTPIFTALLGACSSRRRYSASSTWDSPSPSSGSMCSRPIAWTSLWVVMAGSFSRPWGPPSAMAPPAIIPRPISRTCRYAYWRRAARRCRP
ncbi:hypothetical protein Q427_20080 [Halomonas sp. BC04]|nr:DMT family transporter [Halomonas sp. BC04]EWH00337.1 hypothetical protein Q427_20080 [Halomonas sp. BC04]